MNSNRGVFYISLLNLAAIIAVAVIVGYGLLENSKDETADPEKAREMAAMLEARGLYKAALSKLENYRQSADLAEKDEARLLYRMGTIAQDEIGQFERAAAYYTMAAALAPSAKWKPDADKRAVVCLEKSGRREQSRALLRQVTGEDDGSPSLSEEHEPQGPVVAVVDGRSVYWSQVQKLAKLRRKADGPETREDRRRLVQEYVMKLVLAREAVSAGLDTDPEVKSLLDLSRRETLAAAYVAGKVAEPADEKAMEKLWQEASDLHEVNIFYDAVPAP